MRFLPVMVAARGAAADGDEGGGGGVVAGAGDTGGSVAVPHLIQNFASSGSCVPQLEQYFMDDDRLRCVRFFAKVVHLFVKIKHFMCNLLEMCV